MIDVPMRTNLELRDLPAKQVQGPRPNGFKPIVLDPNKQSGRAIWTYFRLERGQAASMGLVKEAHQKAGRMDGPRSNWLRFVPEGPVAIHETAHQANHPRE